MYKSIFFKIIRKKINTFSASNQYIKCTKNFIFFSSNFLNNMREMKQCRGAQD
jgi:hypothetical protein